MRITGRAIPLAPAYPLIVGVLALVLTVSMTIPFASILIVAVLLRRDRWKEIVLVSSLGSATGGLILYLTFHYLGWSQISAYYPDLPQSKAWADATRWVSAYGTWALLGFAAAPLPQTPALIFTAMSRLPVPEVFLALFLGKLLKYGVYGWIASEFPSWFQRYTDGRVQTYGAMSVTSDHSDPLRRGLANRDAELDTTPSRWTAIKQILACVDGTDKDQSVLNYALQVALHFSSHIDVLHVHFDVRGASADKRSKPLVDRFLDIPVERAATEAAVRAHRHFENWQTQCKLPLSDTGTAIPGPSTLWREILGYENEIIARLGRLSDLIVIARPSKLSSSFSLIALETALFDTSRPVLMVPDGVPMNLFHRPIIAWNGSREAARAVGFALPFLTECESGVDIFAAPEQKHCTETDELQRYLSWHGVVAERVLVEESRPIGMSLLAQASSNRAGLIVMGAYTHGHYRQFLFGGMTRYVMDHAATPVLLAH